MGDGGDNNRLVIEGAVKVDATDARWLELLSDGHVDDQEGMGERGERDLRAGVACRLARLSRSDSLSFGTAAGGGSVSFDILGGDDVNMDVVASMLVCLRGMDAVQMSAPLRPPSLNRARAGETRGYLRD